MNRWCIALLGLVLANPAAAQKIPDVAEMKAEPAGDWSVDYGDWQCELKRTLKVGGKRALFSFTLEPIISRAWMRLAIEDAGGRRGDGDAVMSIDGKRIDGVLHYNIYDAGAFRMREFMLDMGRHRLGEAKQRIRFWTRAHGDVEMELGGFAPAWRALLACRDDLYSSFGFKQGDLEQMATPPGGQIYAFVTDIPRPPAGGKVEFAYLYWVGTNGRIDECRLLMPSGHADFDKGLCESLKAKAKLKPARNAKGEAIRVPQFEHSTIRTASF